MKSWLLNIGIKGGKVGYDHAFPHPFQFIIHSVILPFNNASFMKLKSIVYLFRYGLFISGTTNYIVWNSRMINEWLIDRDLEGIIHNIFPRTIPAFSIATVQTKIHYRHLPNTSHIMNHAIFISEIYHQITQEWLHQHGCKMWPLQEAKNKNIFSGHRSSVEIFCHIRHFITCKSLMWNFITCEATHLLAVEQSC
jgi:hypothetical protein